MQRIKSIVITKKNEQKEFKNLKTASRFLNKSSTDIETASKYDTKLKGWNVSLKYIGGCIECGAEIHRLDTLCHKCYIKDLNYDPNQSERSEIGSQVQNYDQIRI